jgi:hypothetical protein
VVYVHTGANMALSDTWLKANNGRERAALEKRSDRDGLGVRVTPKGKIIFQLRYRYDGAPKRLDLGSYPLQSLKDVRAEAQRLKGQLEQGHDPKIVRLLAKQAILKADSIETLFRQWYDLLQEEQEGSPRHPAFLRAARLPEDRSASSGQGDVARVARSA